MVDDRSDLANAIALNSSMVNGARLLGPALAGIVIAAVGEGYCFLLDGISYIAVILSLLLMRVAPAPTRAGRQKVLADLIDGWQYVKASFPIRSILLLLALVSLVGMPYTVLMPIFASQVLHGGPHTLGWLMAATGVGALTSAIVLASRRSVLGLGRTIAISAAVFGAALIGFSTSRLLWLSLTFLLFTGFGFIQQMAASNTILQTIVAEEKRGRVMSFYAMAFQGVAPFGSLFAGFLAARIGAPYTLALGGCVCVAGAVWFFRRLPSIRRHVRPRYVELGILPEVAAGLHSTALLQTPPEA
jgi:MFS family permease